MLDTAQNRSEPAWVPQLITVEGYVQHCLRFGEIDGFLDDIQGYTLMLLAEQGPAAGAIVEIGSFAGRSTCWLAAGAKAAGREKVFAVDTFQGSPEHQPGRPCCHPVIESEGSTLRLFKENIKAQGLDGHVEAIVATSEEASAMWDRPIRLLFIDGDHSYEASKMDYARWSPFVAPGGMIAFHDINQWEGVTRFYHALLACTKEYTEVLVVGSLHVIQRTRNRGLNPQHAETPTATLAVEHAPESA